MPDDPSLKEALAPNLQSTLDKKLTAGEVTLMTLGGAHGEALVVTDRRVMIVREQMPIVAGETQVDCFDYPYEQISTVRVDSTVGGGHLTLVLLTPPVADHEATLYFPPYDQTKFEAAAARIRLLAEHSRSGPPGVSTASAAASAAVCRSCGAPVREQGLYCSHCGDPVAKACGFCGAAMLADALFCTRCGAEVAHARAPVCSDCGRPVSALFVYCPHCGRGQGARCNQCGGRVLPGWARCPSCGQNTERQAIGTTPAPWSDHGSDAGADSASGAGATAEEHNARGMRLYNQELYEDARREFETALDLDPGNPLYHCNLGVVLAETGNDAEALEEYQVAVRLAPDDPTAFLNLGYFHSERENDEEARKAWEKVIELAPDGPEADEARQNLEHNDEV